MFYIIMTSMKKQVKASNIRLSIWIPTLRQDHYYEDTISNLNKLWRWEDNPEVEIITIENKLVNDARNEIVEKAKWEYILIINDDLIIYEWTIEKMMFLLDYHTVACSNFTRADNNQKLLVYNHKNICWFCYMIKKKDKDKLFPIPQELQLRYWDNRIYNRAREYKWDWRWWKVHHWESKTIYSKQQKERCDKIIALDKQYWFSYYKYI